MKPILRAIGLMSGASAISVVLGLVSAKVTALLLGPAGVGFWGLLQSATGLAVLAAMVGGINAGMVRTVTRARADGDRPAEAATLAAAWLLCVGGAVVMAVAMVAARSTVARVLLGGAEHAAAVWPLALAVILTVVTTVQVGVISAYHQIGRVARINISNSVVGPLILVPFVLGWRESALPWVVLLGSVATVTVSAAYFPREALGVLSVRRYPGRRSGLGAAVGELLRFGVPFNVSAIAGTGVQLAMPVVVLHVLGDAAVGFYRAAAGISLTYLAFLQSALGQDYYPRIAACGDDTVRQAALVEDQMRAVLLVAGPIILVVLAAAPVLVPLIYTREFVPAVALLEWQLAGDVLRIAATTMSLAILARAGGLTFLGVEVFTGAATLAMSWVGVRALALPGLGMAFFASSLVAACANAVVLRRVLGRSLGGRTLMVIAGYTAAALVTRFIASAGLGAPGALAAGAVALAGVAFSARAIWTEVDGWEGLRKLFRLA